jgi:molybdopterin-guanine dinucleotide biosynthesis protein A
MGADKGALPFADETMLERIIRITRTIADDLIVVGRRDQPGVTVHDAIEDQGPLSGIAAGLAASTTDLNLVVACDMPLINAAVLQRLVEAIGGEHDICVAMIDGHASALCGVYRSRVAKTAQSLFDAGERRVMPLLDLVQTKRVDAALLRDIDPNLETFLSCDTPDKYQRALALAGSREPEAESR